VRNSQVKRGEEGRRREKGVGGNGSAFSPPCSRKGVVLRALGLFREGIASSGVVVNKLVVNANV
jgi:hypothetical protein